MSLYTDSQLQYITFAGTAVYPMLHSMLANASTAYGRAFNMQSHVCAVYFYVLHSMSAVYSSYAPLQDIDTSSYISYFS